MRIAVIGGGISGLLALHTLQKRLLNCNLYRDLEIVAFERGEQVGGEWVLSDKPEQYVNDLPITSSVYKDMQTNIPAPAMQLHPDFPWPAGIRSFPYRDEYLAYIESFCQKFDLSRFIRFSSAVLNIRRQPENCKRLLITVKDLKSGNECTENFDFVFVCVGKHTAPHIPRDVDLSKFSGLKFHYHDLKDPERLRDKRVLVVGASFGAMDMAILLPKRVQKLYISWNKHKPFWFNEGMHKTISLRPKMIAAEGNTVHFADGSSADVDVILYCTGFRHVHPFEGDLNINFNEMGTLFPAYKHVVHPLCPSIFFIGKSFLVINHISRLQSEFACQVIEGRIILPKQGEMLNDIDKFREKWLPKFANMFDGDFTSSLPIVEVERELGEYLSKATGCEPIGDLIFDLSYAVIKAMKSDCQHYKQYRLRNDLGPKLENYFLEDGEASN